MIKGDNMQYLTLANGNKMPILGYGVFQIDPKKTQACVEDALALDIVLSTQLQFIIMKRP